MGDVEKNTQDKSLSGSCVEISFYVYKTTEGQKRTLLQAKDSHELKLRIYCRTSALVSMTVCTVGTSHKFSTQLSMYGTDVGTAIGVFI